MVLGTTLELFRWRGQAAEKDLNGFYFVSLLGEALCDAVRRGEEVESFARSSMLSCVFICCAQHGRLSPEAFAQLIRH